MLGEKDWSTEKGKKGEASVMETIERQTGKREKERDGGRKEEGRGDAGGLWGVAVKLLQESAKAEKPVHTQTATCTHKERDSRSGQSDVY